MEGKFLGASESLLVTQKYTGWLFSTSWVICEKVEGDEEMRDRDWDRDRNRERQRDRERERERVNWTQLVGISKNEKIFE